MVTSPMSLLYFLVAALGFSFVIFIHELGHFVFAKWAGVKVDIFSLGFGTRLIGFQIGETDYRISALPFGGYVHMLGQEDGAAQPVKGESVDPRSFLAKSPGWRAIILLGGVLFNLISSYLILLGLAFYGMPVRRPMVATVSHLPTATAHTAGSPADRLGLRVGDTVLAIDGAPVREWEDVVTTAMVEHDKPLTITVRRRTNPDLMAADPKFVVLDLPAPGTPPIYPMYDPDLGRSVLGIEATPLGNRIGGISANAGPDAPQIGERIVGIDGHDLPSDPPGTPINQKKELLGQQIATVLEPWLGRTVDLTLERDGHRRTVAVRYGGDGTRGVYDQLIGFPILIDFVEPDMPAAAAGIVPGDIVMAVDGTPIAQHGQCLRLMGDDAAAGRPMALTVWHAGATRTVSITAKEKDGALRFGIGPTVLNNGTIPVLPTLIDGSPSPLAQAGIKPGDALVVADPGDNAASDDGKMHYAVLSGGDTLTIPVDRAALKNLENPSAAWLWHPRHDDNPIDALVGRQITVINPGSDDIRLSDASGNPSHLSLKAVTNLVPTFAKVAQMNDWITGHHHVLSATTAGADDEDLVLEIRRGAAAPVMKSWDAGVLIACENEEVPYVISGPGEAFSMVDDAAYNMVVKTFQLIPRFFRSADNGGISANKSLTGPIGMFTQLKVRVQHFGFTSFLKFVALIGLNLFLVNLLPIPITDGGHLMFLGIEVLMRRPVPVLIHNAAMYAGLIFVAGMMLYVMGLDISRLVGLG
jgi:membrane-associated protease RseP (regulator of RpoE activity)